MSANMSANAFARFPHLMRTLTALILLIAGQAATPSFAAAAEPNSAGQSSGQWFMSLLTTYNQKSFCIPATTSVIDVTKAVAQYTEQHQTSGQLTAPIAIQILAQLYPCQVPSTTANAAVPKTDEATAPVGMQTLEIMRTLQNTAGHENDAVLTQITGHADAYPPPVLFGLARVLFRRGDVDDSIFWFNAARLRGNFDAWRSPDVVSARAAMVAMSRQMPIELRKAQFADLQKLRTIVNKVITWDETTPRNYDRRWIDFHGVAVNKSGPGPGKPAVSPGIIAPEKWDDLAKQVREEYRQDLEKSIVMMNNAMNNAKK
jgi:hypothetical protein